MSNTGSKPKAGDGHVEVTPGFRFTVRGFPVVLTRKFPFGLLLLVAMGWLLANLGDNLRDDSSPVPNWSLRVFLAGLIFATSVYVVILCHEAAHAVVASKFGYPPQWAKLGAVSAGVKLPRDPTGWARISISAAGPLAEMLCSLILITPSITGSLIELLTAPTALAGLGMFINGAVGLIVPLGRRSDAAKIYRGIREIRRPATT